MTATTESSAQKQRRRGRHVRFSSMEILGFANPASVWSESPTTPPITRRGRHEAPPPEPVAVADWEPEDFEELLPRRRFRWSPIIVALVVLTGLTGTAYWLYQRPEVQAEASQAAVTSQARVLDDVLPALDRFNESLLTAESGAASDLFAVDQAARTLFDVSGDLPPAHAATRSAAAAASASTLDGVRLAGDANSYRLAVTPILAPPDLETDPSLIELDEAARAFGDWQLRFDEVRTALPDGVLSGTTEQLDILSGDLPSLLTRYVDALGEDDQTAVEGVVADLGNRLDQISVRMTDSLTEVQTRVSERIAETRLALQKILDGQ